MQILLKNLLEATRNQRHDFLNHLQVIWGYLSLGLEDKAIEYIKEVTDYLNNLRVLNNITNVELAADITGKVLELGLKRSFLLEISKGWTVEENQVKQFKDFFNKLWKMVVLKISDEEFCLKLILAEGKVILETHNIIDIDSFAIWENTKKLAKEYGFSYETEPCKITVNI
ncbi:MAG: hypothetical protein GXY91_05070 [Clostridia bacterium]|nr:hypothetical protein [Clostridia bacterium]